MPPNPPNRRVFVDLGVGRSYNEYKVVQQLSTIKY